MFRDLKEYQTIQKIYEEQILKSPHEDLIIEAFQSEEFTVEEIDYVLNNIDQLCDDNLLREENNDLNEAIGKVVKTVVQKAAPKLVNTAQKASKAVASGIKAGADKATPAVKNVASSATKKFGSALGKVKAGLSRAGQAVSSQVSKAKPLLKKGLETAKKVIPAAAAVGGAVAATKAIKNRLNKNKDTSSEIESDANYAKSNAKFNQRFKDANTDTSKDIESSEQSAKAEARPKRRPVPSPMEAGMGPGAAKARAMAKARIAAKKANPNQKQLSGKERAQAMAKARIAAKKKASQSKSTPSVDSFKQGMKTPLNASDTKKPETKQQDTSTGTKTNTGKIIPKPNTGTDTQGTRKQIPQPNTGTDTQTKTNTQIKKFPGSGKEINPKAKVTQTKSNNDSFAPGKEVTTTKTKTNLQGSEATDAIKKAKERRAQLRANSMKEAYASMYNQPVESENLDEGVKKVVAKKVVKGVKKVGKLIKQGVRKAGQEGGPQKPKKGFYNVKAGPNSQVDYSVSGFKKVRPEGGGKRTVKATYGKKPEKTFMQSQKDKLEAQRQGISVKELDAARDAEIAASKDAVAKALAPRSGVDVRKGKKATKRTSFQDKDFKPKYENYEPYDIVLEYLLSSEQAATIEEANYIMTEMDAETIQGIVSEGLGSAIKKVGKIVGGAVKKGIKKVKGRQMMGDFPVKGGGPYTA